MWISTWRQPTGTGKSEMNSHLKLAAVAVIVVGATAYLAYLGAISSWQYYLSVDETVADTPSLIGNRIRVSGRVGVGSLKISGRRRQATFDLKGTMHTLHATCRCAMPDNLVEDIDVVVEGVLRSDGIHGHKVITRCASKYQSKATVAALDQSPGTGQLR
jgi:cytochrome c-type biogenesis protein CcmE